MKFTYYLCLIFGALHAPSLGYPVMGSRGYAVIR